jgi:hypothetical protein
MVIIEIDLTSRFRQVKSILRLKAAFEAVDNPTLSMNTKKRGTWGNFYRAERLVFDQDCASFAEGAIIPHSPPLK